MHYWIALAVILGLCGCQAFHVTKLYYDEYINPKATVDYTPEKVASIPPAVLDAYVRMDGAVTRVADALAKVESFPDELWLGAMATELPAVRQWAVLDRYFFPRLGGPLPDTAALESFAAAADKAPMALGAVALPEGLAVVRKFTERSGDTGFVVAVLPMALEQSAPLAAMVVGRQVVAGHLETAALEALQAELATTKRFAGARAVAGTRYRWLLSARDQLRIAYVYRDKE